MFQTSVSAGNGKRAIKNTVNGNQFTYVTGNLESRQQAEAAFRADWATMINNLVNAGHIVAAREYPLPTLQKAYAAYID